MLTLYRLLIRAIELALVLPVSACRAFISGVVFNPRLGALRYAIWAAGGYLLFALLLVYVAAPLRGVIGGHFMAEKLRYDAERWLATAVYDVKGNFVGTFDPRLDSRRDVNYTDTAIEIGNYTANPDHKSIPVREVPAAYWQCLSYHEDRYIGTAAEPLWHRPDWRAQDPVLEHSSFDCIKASDARRGRIDLADAIRSRHLQDAAQFQ